MLIEQSLTESSDKPPEYQKLQIRVSARELLGSNFEQRAVPYIPK